MYFWMQKLNVDVNLKNTLKWTTLNAANELFWDQFEMNADSIIRRNRNPVIVYVMFSFQILFIACFCSNWSANILWLWRLKNINFREFVNYLSITSFFVGFILLKNSELFLCISGVFNLNHFIDLIFIFTKHIKHFFKLVHRDVCRSMTISMAMYSISYWMLAFR